MERFPTIIKESKIKHNKKFVFFDTSTIIRSCLKDGV